MSCNYYKIESISLTKINYTDCISGSSYVDVISREGPTYVCSTTFPEYVSGDRDYIVVDEGYCTYQTPTPTVTPTITKTPTQTPTPTQTSSHTPTPSQTSSVLNCNYYQITNYNTVEQGFYAWTGCTGIVSVTPIDPLDSHFVCAYDLYVQDCGAPLTKVFVGICSFITPTPSVTPTRTPSVTQTPTLTPTPSITQTFIPVYNLWGAGYFEDACGEAGYGPANVAIYSAIPFEALQIGDFVYGNASCTIPPVFVGNIVSDGARWAQFNIANGQVLDIGICF